MASIELHFAQRLASNERQIRDKAIKKLKKYLQIRSNSKRGFTEDDFLRIFKGLHYCLWMQDKPIFQEELIEKITLLVHTISDPKQVIAFIKVFFITEIREWSTIDKWRIDKFMRFIRHFLRQSLRYMKNNNWQIELLQSMSNALLQTILNPENTKVPTGIRMYFNSIFLDELRNSDLSDIDKEQLCMCLEPFITFSTNSQQKDVVTDVIKNVIKPIINRPFTTKQFDSTEISEWLADELFTLGKNPECDAWHRKQFYALVKSIKDVQTD